MRQNHSREQAARQLAEQAASVHGSPAESGWKQRQSDREPAMRQPAPAVETPRPGRPEGGRNPVFVSNDRTEDAERLAPASDRTSAGSIPAAGGAVQTADQEAGMAAVPAERIHAVGPDGMLSQNGSEELIYRQMPEDPETAVPASKRNIPAESNFRREAGGQPTKPEQSAGPNNVPFAAGTSASAPSTPAAAPSDGPANTMPAAKPKEHRRVQGRMDGAPPLPRCRPLRNRRRSMTGLWYRLNSANGNRKHGTIPRAFLLGPARCRSPRHASGKYGNDVPGRTDGAPNHGERAHNDSIQPNRRAVCLGGKKRTHREF